MYGKEIYVLEKNQHKTGELVRLQLSEPAKEFLPEKLFDNMPVFKVRTDQVTNRRLKEIMKLAGINKNITFHSARHTFATLAIVVGINPVAVSKMVGHKDLKTTMLYVKMTSQLLGDEMAKINEAFTKQE